MSTILVPVDFSDETPEVIECATMMARRNRSGLVLLRVAEDAPAAEADEMAAEHLERLERYLREEGIPVSTAVRTGEPARQIVELGGAIHADCIIIGRHDHGPLDGSEKSPITRAVEQQASCTVVAVP
jgi:nucleotide-binding universal stress UspA family protein